MPIDTRSKDPIGLSSDTPCRRYRVVVCFRPMEPQRTVGLDFLWMVFIPHRGRVHCGVGIHLGGVELGRCSEAEDPALVCDRYARFTCPRCDALLCSAWPGWSVSDNGLLAASYDIADRMRGRQGVYAMGAIAGVVGYVMDHPLVQSLVSVGGANH
jgi:hypothetical protein